MRSGFDILMVSFPFADSRYWQDMLNSDLGIEYLSMALNRTREQSISWNLRGGAGNVDHGGIRNPPHNRKGADRKLFS